MPSLVSRGAAMRGSGTAVAVVCFFALLDNALGFCPKGQRFDITGGGTCESDSPTTEGCTACGLNEYQDDAQGELRSLSLSLFLSLSLARARARGLCCCAGRSTHPARQHGEGKADHAACRAASFCAAPRRTARWQCLVLNCDRVESLAPVVYPARRGSQDAKRRAQPSPHVAKGRRSHSSIPKKQDAPARTVR